MTPHRAAVVSEFSHRIHSNEPIYDVLNGESFKSSWEMDISHEKSGPCYTYNSQRASDPGYEYFIRIVPNTGNKNDSLKKRLSRLHIYLHKPGHFFFDKRNPESQMVQVDTHSIKDTNQPMIAGNILHDNTLKF